ncbi:MAG: lysophospholipid acyltransferase family protein [Saprospiraceae bacterium]|nr:lysophospholipid acyltransferase family protein [Saprospiraceae bacterium]
MPLIEVQEFQKTLNLEKYGPFGKKLSQSIMRFFKIDKINHIYQKFRHLRGAEFIDAVLDDLNIEVSVSLSDLKRIPKSGPFIIVANHPLGGIDGLILLKIMLEAQPNSKILANFLLSRIEPLQPYICPVNPFESNKDLFCSISGIRAAISHLKEGLPLGIFPAGEVSTRQNNINGKITDKEWDMSVMKLIRKAGVPVIPLYFNTRNSDFFYMASSIHPNLRTALLPNEMFSNKVRKVEVRVGMPVCPEAQQSMQDIDQLSAFLRQKTYFLENYISNEVYFKIKLKSNITETTPIIPKTDNTILKDEIDLLERSGKVILKSGNYKVLFSKLHKNSPLIRETGRLREITFREIGEGTGKEADLDKYDAYYHHLILWDTTSCEIAGAYRLGLGKDIINKFGISGFYMTELFNLNGPVIDIFSEAIEMGRAFIVKTHQRKATPLFILWKGIVEVTRLYPEYKYLIGAASISNSYCAVSQGLMIEYFKKNHTDNQLSHFVKPKNKFKPAILKGKYTYLKLIENMECLKKMDKLIEELEPGGLKIPILIKKYLLQNARMLGFSVDKNFSNVIDGLIYIKVSDIEKEKFN